LNGLGIEPFAGEGLPLSGVRAGRSLILFMELVESDFSRREVMDFLTFADLVVDEGAKEAPNTALWDLLSKEAGIVRGISDWRRKLSAMSVRGWSPRSAGTGREDGGVDTGAAVKTLAEAVDHLYSKVSGLRVKDAPSRLAEDLCAAFCFFVGPSEERDIVLDEVRALSALDPCERLLDRSLFFWLVRRQLDSTQMRTGSMRGRGPVIAGLMTSRGLPFKVVVLPGLNEGSFPAPARQDPILLDWERSFLNEALEKLAVDGRLGLKGDRPKEERLLFRLAAGAASQRLILTFSRIEPLTGAERLASELLLETAGSVAGKRCGPGSLDGLPFYKRVPLDKLYPEDDSYLDGAEFDLMAAAGAVAKVRGALEYLKAGESFLSNSLDAESRRWGQFRFTPYDGVMESPKALKLLEGRYAGRRGIVSPTALETYAACPFRYFVRYILGAETIESPEEVLSIAPIDKGALAHSILENTYKRIFEGGSGPADGWEKTLHSIASRLLGAFRKENPFGLPLLWDIDEARLKDDLYMAMAQDIAELGGYVPWKQEVRFGYGPKSATEGDAGQEGVKATEMKLDDGRVVSFGGKIDRLDLDSAQGAARVIDYKTGKGAGYKEDSLVGGTTLQLPLYIIGAQQLLGCDAEVVDAQYFLVSGEKRGGRIHFTGEALRERMADLIMAVGTIVRGIESGLFFAYPGDSCMYCEYKPACGDGQNLYERKCTDPRVRDFLRMKEME
jgi:ATP-dependent helicase/nuclease subunit B